MFQNISLLTEYSFIVVALGTSILALSTAMVGSVNILKGQSLIGDVVGHASFLGVVLAFMLFTQRNPLILMLGAMVAGVLAFIIIEIIASQSKMNADTVMAIVLSSFFGLGMVFKSYIQGNPKFNRASQSGLASYIFGQAAYILKEDVIIIFTVSVISLILFLIFYKEIKIYIFDEVYAKTVGIRQGFIFYLIMIMTLVLISAGLKAVGGILISSMLIIPAVVGMQWSNRYGKVLFISAMVGVISALFGTILSSLVKGFPTGPSIVLIMSSFAIFSMIFSPRGSISMRIRQKKL